MDTPGRAIAFREGERDRDEFLATFYNGGGREWPGLRTLVEKVTEIDYPVIGGLFTINLAFHGAFTGTQLYLEVSVDGTPTMFLNGTRVPNPTDFGALAKQIDAALQTGGG